MDEQTCTNCQKSVPGDKFPTHEAYCSRNILKCPLCLETYDKKEADDHSYLHQIISCNQCGQKHERRLLQQHMKNCTGNKMECEFCQIPIKSAEFIEHIVRCGGRTQECTICGKFVALREKQTHVCEEKKPKQKPKAQNSRRLQRNIEEEDDVQIVEVVKPSKKPTGKYPARNRAKRNAQSSNSERGNVVSISSEESASVPQTRPKRLHKKKENKPSQEQSKLLSQVEAYNLFESQQGIQEIGDDLLRQAIELSKLQF